mgnify:CR=1 FL=1
MSRAKAKLKNVHALIVAITHAMLMTLTATQSSCERMVMPSIFDIILCGDVVVVVDSRLFAILQNTKPKMGHNAKTIEVTTLRRSPASLNRIQIPPRLALRARAIVNSNKARNPL